MARTTNHPQKMLRALVLDADAASLRAVSRSLEARSFTVLGAADGSRGLDLLLEELLSLDVLVVDAALPHRDACAFAELIRRAGGERDLALVAVTRDASPDFRAVLLALGVDAVVDRSEGPEAAAAAAVGAIAARRARQVEAAPEPERAPAREPDEAPAPFSFRLAGGWALLTA